MATATSVTSAPTRMQLRTCVKCPTLRAYLPGESSSLLCSKCQRKQEIKLRNDLAYAVRIIAESGSPVATLKCR